MTEAELSSMIAELHCMMGGKSHGNARGDHACAVARLRDIMLASRENSLYNGRLETENAILRRVCEAAKYRAFVGHNDTCGLMLTGEHPCSCGHDHLTEALRLAEGAT
jgi:hypothetical protein